MDTEKGYVRDEQAPEHGRDVPVEFQPESGVPRERKRRGFAADMELVDRCEIVHLKRIRVFPCGAQPREYLFAQIVRAICRAHGARICIPCHACSVSLPT